MEATQTSHTPAHDVAATVAPFRAWRGSRLVIAGGPVRVTIADRSFASGSLACCEEAGIIGALPGYFKGNPENATDDPRNKTGPRHKRSPTP